LCVVVATFVSGLLFKIWSGRRESNPRPTAWKAVTLPLSYSRPYCSESANQRVSESASRRGVENPLKNLELMMGLEPMTSPLPRECSTTELHQPSYASHESLARFTLG